EQHVLDEAMQRRADHGGGQEGDQHADDETARGGIVEQAARDREQAAEIDRQDGENRAELDQHREGLAELLVAESEEMAEEEQVPGRGDRDELGQAFDNAQKGRLDDVEQHGSFTPGGAIRVAAGLWRKTATGAIPNRRAFGAPPVVNMLEMWPPW